MTGTRISDIMHKRLGWCPKHGAATVPSGKAEAGLIILALICAMVIPAVGLSLLVPPTQEVTVWAFRMDDSGDLTFAALLPATEDAGGKLSFSAAGAATPALPAGRYRLVIEHPVSDGSLRLMLDGGNVIARSPGSPDADIPVFRLVGTGSLRGMDAYEALMAAFARNSPFEDLRSLPGSFGEVTEREYIVE